MDAGAGAQEQARRHERRIAAMEAERAAMDTERAAIDARIESARQQQLAWAAGAEGERRVGARLEALGPGWRVLHDVHWPGRPKANIDHIAVGPTGVWVVDAKNWSGEVSVRDGVLRCSGWRKVRETESVATAAAAVAALLQPFHRLLVRPLLCLAGSGSDLPAQPTPSGTTVSGVTTSAETLVGAPVCLQPGEVAAIADYLQQQLGGRTSPTLTTTAHIPAQPSSVREPSHEVRSANNGRQRGRTLRPGPTVVPRRTPSGSSRGRPPSAVRGCLGVLLKITVFLVLTWLFLALMPVWAPLLQELVSSLFLQPMLDNIAEQTGQPPVSSTPGQ